MFDFDHSSQLNSWHYTPQFLKECRERANRNARLALSSPSNELIKTGVPAYAEEKKTEEDDANKKQVTKIKVQRFARGYHARHVKGQLTPEDVQSTGNDNDDDSQHWQSSPARGSFPLLTPTEELLLQQFYVGKLVNLIGPRAPVGRCRRDMKVVATAATLFRRFFLSNSVMFYDPKSIMVCAAFLASKVEDSTVDVRALEEGTSLMQSHVTVEELLKMELILLEGLEFDLMCFHPYKTVLAYTEDLRAFLKSERGYKAAIVPVDHPSNAQTHNNQEDESSSSKVTVGGEDLRPIHDEARRLVDDVCVSDIVLLYTPGQIGLAAMLVASETISQKALEEQIARREWRQKQQMQQQQGGPAPDAASSTPPNITVPPVLAQYKVDIFGYMRQRFESRTPAQQEALQKQLMELSAMLRQLRVKNASVEDNYGCGNAEVDMAALKAVHKKLKKCRVWGVEDGKSQEKEGKKKKKGKKKRKATAVPDGVVSSSGDVVKDGDAANKRVKMDE